MATLQFDGTKTFAYPPSDLWEKFRTASFLVQCIPGVETVSQAEEDQAVCVIRPGFAFVRGTLEMTVRVLERQPVTGLRYEFLTKGIGSSSAVETRLTLTLEGTGTQVQWVAEVRELGGLLKAVPQALVRGAARKIAEDAWTAVEAKLNG